MNNNGKAGAVDTERPGEDEEMRARPGRRPAADRTRAVLELLAGKATVEQLARRYGVQPATVEGWRAAAIESIGETMRQASQKSPRERELEKKLHTLEKAFTDLAIRHELVQRFIESRPTRPGKSGK